MAEIARQLTVEDVGAVSAWLAAQAVPGQGKPAMSFKGELTMPCGSVRPPHASAPATGRGAR